MTMYSHFDGTNLTVVVDGDVFQSTQGDPNFDALFESTKSGDESAVRKAADTTAGVADAFSELSAEVVIKYGRVFWKDIEISGVLSDRILELVAANEDATPLIRFLEKIQRNPDAHSREQLFGWLTANKAFSIDEQGELIAYKSVRKTDRDNVYESMHAGTASVNDVEQVGRIKQRVGDVVTMPRESVMHDPAAACHTGLHAASKGYATSWSSFDALLLLAINPRDVVSVPTDSSGAKMRVCRYRVVEVVDNSHELDDAYYAVKAGGDWYEYETDDLEDEDDDLDNYWDDLDDYEYGIGDDDDDDDDDEEDEEDDLDAPVVLNQLRKPTWRTWFN